MSPEFEDGHIENMEFNFIRHAKKMVEVDLHLAIMAGPLNSLEGRLKEAIGRSMDLMYLAAVRQMEQTSQKRGINE